jgi:uncharacterized protein (TIGR02145 family)
VNVNVKTDAPVVNAGIDTSVFVGTTVNLRGSATQQFGAFTQWEWKISSGGTWAVRRADTSFTAPLAPQSILCSLRVTDDDGNKDMDIAMVTVADVPVGITAHPQAVTVDEPQIATFSVTATGTNLTYQWQKDGGNISGATGASYSTPATKVETYYGSEYRCVVTNGAGSVNSDAATLTVQFTGTVTVDGVVYQTVQIGKQVWMKENLRATHYNEGTEIPLVTDNAADWEARTTGAYCFYSNSTDPAEQQKWGALYNWYVVDPANLKKIAPAGWHVPTDAEWTVLETYLGGSTVAGKKMKTTTGWADNGNGTDESGFSGLPGGGRWRNGSYNNSQSGTGFWWGATEYGADAWGRHLRADGESLYRGGHDGEGCGFSVRLLRDSN